ncbi:hypothetical protein FWF74_00975 [Candidatus Saccharibacteria bacterium]|nr:hypothetical protein [Candidatus Saccharibacteria bacterium]MCL1963238.1 hypothetical protein [Candidatus Saccharibacteria bacterium]
MEEGKIPVKPDIEIRARHDQSAHDYPFLTLEAKEYVVTNVERSIWGRVRIWGIAILLAIALMAATVLIGYTTGDSQLVISFLIGGLLALCVLVCGGIAVSVFNKNTFIVTNFRVYMHIQTTPFSFRVQNIELKKIEDFSYSQSGMLEIMLNYGSIKFTTVGDETSYPFDYVDDPSEEFKVINEVIKVANSGHPKHHHPKNGD